MVDANKCLLAAWVCLAFACSPRATPGDLAAFEHAREMFSDSFEIELKRDIYIEARYDLDECPVRAIAESMYRVLLMDGDAPRPDSNFVYLNLWDAGGQFCYQLAYDPTTRRIETSDQPYY